MAITRAAFARSQCGEDRGFSQSCGEGGVGNIDESRQRLHVAPEVQGVRRSAGQETMELGVRERQSFSQQVFAVRDAAQPAGQELRCVAEGGDHCRQVSGGSCAQWWPLSLSLSLCLTPGRGITSRPDAHYTSA